MAHLLNTCAAKRINASVVVVVVVMKKRRLFLLREAMYTCEQAAQRIGFATVLDNIMRGVLPLVVDSGWRSTIVFGMCRLLEVRL